jgi:uncharacterized phage protein (TIGR01671 family)
MDREIKFRAWDGREMRPVYGVDEHLLYLDAGPTRAKMCGADISIERMARADGVLMQFTGLEDKNDNPVYEGDIIDLHQTVNGCNLFVVEWGKIGWTVRYGIKMITPRTYEYSVEDLFKPCQFSGEVDYEVIGNIYQHDHLLRNE